MTVRLTLTADIKSVITHSIIFNLPSSNWFRTLQSSLLF